MSAKREKIRIGLAQVNPTVGDLKGNSALVRKWLREAKIRGVQIVAFPELVLCGYPPRGPPAETLLPAGLRKGAERAREGGERHRGDRRLPGEAEDARRAAL